MEVRTNIKTRGRAFYCELRVVKLNGSTKHHGELTDTMILLWS